MAPWLHFELPMHKCRRRYVVAGGLLVCVLAGCAIDPVEPEPASSEAQQQIGDFDEEHNGRSTVGPAFEAPLFLPSDATEYFSVGTTRTRDDGTGLVTGTVEFTGGASLKSTTFNNLVGVVLSSGVVPAPGDVHLKITSVRPDGAITHYGLDAADGTGP